MPAGPAKVQSIVAHRARAIAAPCMAAIFADEVQTVEMAVVTAASRTFEFHSNRN